MSDSDNTQDDAAMSPASAGSVEPVAWAVMSGSDIVYDIYDIEGEAVAICLWLRDEEDDGSWVTVPLYQAQPQPWLTNGEREAVECGIQAIGLAPRDERTLAFADALQRLLDRTK